MKQPRIEEEKERGFGRQKKTQSRTILMKQLDISCYVLRSSNRRDAYASRTDAEDKNCVKPPRAERRGGGNSVKYNTNETLVH